jgi:hypothetical protein
MLILSSKEGSYGRRMGSQSQQIEGGVDGTSRMEPPENGRRSGTFKILGEKMGQTHLRCAVGKLGYLVIRQKRWVRQDNTPQYKNGTTTIGWR